MGVTGLSAFQAMQAIFGGGSYADKVLSYAPIAYWILGEEAGAVAADQVNSPAQDGAYTGVTLANATSPAGLPCPFFDGANDFVNVLTGALNAVFDGQEGTAVLWVKANAAAVWTDGAFRTFYNYFVDGPNNVRNGKSNVNNTAYARYRGNNVEELLTPVVPAYTDWFLAAVTWSLTNDAFILYHYPIAGGGGAIGASATLGAWAAGALTIAVVGANTIAPAQVWHGWLSDMILFDRPLLPAELADLAVI